jgi:hypothetical protein
MKASLLTVAVFGLLTLAGLGGAAPPADPGTAGRVPATPAQSPICGTWGHAETYRVVDLTLMADGTYYYAFWSLGGELVETGTYTYAGDRLTLVPRHRQAGIRELPLDETPRVATLTWVSADQVRLRFQSGAGEGDTLVLSRR